MFVVADSARDRAAAYDVLAADLLAVVKDWEQLDAVLRLRGHSGERVQVSEMAAVYGRCAERVRLLVETPIFVDEPPATGTARDRAIKATREAIENADADELPDGRRATDLPTAELLDHYAAAAVDGLLARRGVLRALADTTPAPDDHLRAFVEDTERRLPLLREPDPHSDWSRGVAWTLDRARAFAAAGVPAPPSMVAEAAARLRQDIRVAIDVCYGDLGGKSDTPEDAAEAERAIAHDMARVLDWLAGVPAPAVAAPVTDEQVREQAAAAARVRAFLDARPTGGGDDEQEPAEVMRVETREGRLPLLTADLRALLAGVPAPDVAAPVTDKQAREQAAAAMQRVADVFARNRSGLADAASLWAQGFEGFDSAGQWPVWLEAARALLGVAALPEEASDAR